MTPEEYKDIAPFDDHEFKENMAKLVDEPGFKHALTYVMPDVDYPAFAQQLRTFNNTAEFQVAVMWPFLEMLARKTTAGVSCDGLDHLSADKTYLYLSNHRDIVLDATFLYLCLMRAKFPVGEIALGDNLLIFDWIERLVKLNKGLIVKRGLSRIKAFEAAKQLSSYIHYCITDKRESVWIAQREGRAKDSNDVTQESLVKMLALRDSSSTETILATLEDLDICPTTISYELDPNDYLKATEFLLRRNDPDFVKSEHDDLLSMETGLLGYKGRVHYHMHGSITPELRQMHVVTDKNELFGRICALIDKKIHLGYRLFPSNYISYDRLNNTDRFAGEYTAEDAAKFDAYLQDQLKKVRVADLTDDDRDYMLHMMLTMYANPLINRFRAEGKEL